MRSLNGALAFALLALAGCANNTWTLKSASSNPAAEGAVKATDAANGNTAVHLEVRHLAEPAKIAPSATTYVVWIRPMEGDMRPQNMGALQLDSDLKASLDTVTPLKKFELFVTPEAQATVSSPGNAPALDTIVDRTH